MYLAIDIGGTKTLLALFSRFGRIKAQVKFPTPQKLNDLIIELDKNLQEILPKSPKDIKITVVAFPGLFHNDLPLKAPNLPNWNCSELPACIKKLFKENRLNCPIFYKNDADLAALSECRQLFKSSQKLGMYLTFSTGVGGGLVQHNQNTKDSASFEPGHNTVTYLGHQHEWEKIASAEALRKHYHIIATDIRDKTILADVALRIALGLTPVIREKKPNYIVFGGPLGGMLPLYKTQLTMILKDVLNVKALPKLQTAKHPHTAVIHGAYLYAKTKEKTILRQKSTSKNSKLKEKVPRA